MFTMLPTLVLSSPKAIQRFFFVCLGKELWHKFRVDETLIGWIRVVNHWKLEADKTLAIDGDGGNNFVDNFFFLWFVSCKL
jgi:hypothetical protein